MYKIKNGRDFVGGSMMIVIGVLFIWFGRDLQVGNSFQMGPGYFPTMLSIMLIAIGIVIVGQSLWIAASDDEPDTFNWKAYGLVILAPVFFGLALSGLGLAPTLFVMIVAVTMASKYANLRHSIALGIFLATCSVLIFTRLLSLPVSAFGPWLPYLGS
jgi:hypothetical protein